MNIIEFINDYLAYICIGVTIFSIILFIFLIVLAAKQKKLNKKYKLFMSGADGKNLEEQVLSRFDEVDQLKHDAKNITEEIGKIKENLISAYQKIGVVKYDAFKEMGGKLSFVLVLLDKNNNGILLNSVHSSREGCYTYLKEIIKGESFLELSKEERASLEQAINSTNFME